MGLLTNQYVSESYQGLLNLANPNTGLTTTLQSVTDGLGGTSPLQMSRTQINISGSLTINGSPVAATDTGSLMKTGSVAGNVLTFTKGDGSTFNLSVTSSAPSGTISGSQQIIDLGFLQTSSFNSYTSSNDSKVNSLIASTGSYATTSSLTSLSQSIATTDLGQNNRLTALEGVTGSINRNGLITTGSIGGSQSITGSLNVGGTITATSASFTYVNTVYETASVIYSSGSNQLGDAADDTQTLFGDVNIPSGTLRVDNISNKSLGADLIIASQGGGDLFLRGFGPEIGLLATGSNQWVSINSDTEVTGTLKVTGGITGSLQGTASYATNALSASHAINADTASFYGGTVVSASYAINADTASIARDVIVVGKNNNPGTLTRGTVVRIVGADGNNPLIDSASFINEELSANVFGMLSEDVLTNGFANVVVLGKVTGLNTVNFPAGELLFLSSSGTYSTASVTPPSQSVRLGQVLRQNVNQGSIYFRAENGYELGELHNVIDTANTTGELLAFTSGSYGLWKNQSIGNLGLATTSSVNQKLDTGSFNTYTASMDARTGSYATTGSNIFRGSQVISGSLIGNSLNNGMIFISSEAYESGSVKANISASAAISQSNIFFGNTAGPATANLTGSIVISGSNNIFMGGPRPNTLATAGTYGYSNGNLNIQAGIQTLNTASVYRPATNNNINMSSIAMAFTSGALASPNINNNGVFSTVAINHQSASLNYFNNINNGAVISNANNIQLPFLTTIQQNYFGAATNTINHISSSVTMTGNLTNGGSLTVTNLVSSSVSAANNGLSLNNNIIGGNAVGIWVSGSNPTNRRTVTGNLLGGGALSVTASAVGSEFSSLQNSVVWGQNLIVSGTHPANAFGGTAIFGRYNDATTLHQSQEIVFAVGTGTGTGNRRTGFWITSGSIANVSGSLIVSGGLDVSGGITGAFAIPNFVITTGSIAGTQNITGSVVISGSSPLRVGPSSNEGVIKTLGGSNWLYRSTDTYNTVVGNVQGLNGGFFAGSEKNMVFNGFFSPFATGSNNSIIQGAGDDFISGSGNIFIGSHNGHAGGSKNLLLGATSYSSGSVFDDKFELGTQASSRIFHKQGTDPLQIGDDTQVTGSVSISTVMNLKAQNPLPAGNIGDLAVSSSNQLYFYNGAWTLIV
jgi:hypothetical protein